MAEAEDCALCITSNGPCNQHVCLSCDGSGLVCPRCRGMRRVRVPHQVDQPCPTCREGNNVNDHREHVAIRDYLAQGGWRPLAIEELRERRRLANQRARQEADAYHAEWMRMTGAMYGKERRRNRWQETSDAVAAKYGPPVPLDELVNIPPEPRRKIQ